MDRNTLLIRAYNDYNSTKAKQFCTSKCKLPLIDLLTFLKDTDYFVSTVEMQISRCAFWPELEQYAGSDDYGVLSSVLGMPGLVPSMVVTIGNRALAWKKDYESSSAFVSEILAYCEEKHTDAMGKIEENPVARGCSSLFSLVGFSKDRGPSLLQLATKFIKRENKISGGVNVSSEALLSELQRAFPMHAKELLHSIVELIESSNDSGSIVDIPAVIKFCYPLGFAFKVKTILGNLVFKDKFVPTDVSEQLYAKASKQLTTSLR